MGLFNKGGSGGLSSRERKERDEIIKDALEQKRRDRADWPEVEAEDWQSAEDGYRSEP